VEYVIARGSHRGSTHRPLAEIRDRFLVQLVKSTALASIVGYDELTKTAQILTDATFQPFVIYGLVASIYFVLCYPLTRWSRGLERRLARGTR
jgi:polar amino acid transport system permease protein